MQQGLGFLWFLALGLSALTWLSVEIILTSLGRGSNRRQLTGYEMARQVLDRHEFLRIPIQTFPAWEVSELHSGSAPLLLKESVYAGTSLGALAESTYRAFQYLESSKTVIPSRLRVPAGRWFRTALFASWILIVAGLAFSFWKWMFPLGELLFLGCVFLAAFTLVTEWEVATQAMASLSSLDGLAMDEKIRLKKILSVLRWAPLAEPVDIVLQSWKSFLPRVGKGKVNVRTGR